MNDTVSNYRLKIEQLDNGYIITLDNNNAASKVFKKLEDVLDYIKSFFEVGERDRE